MTKLEETTIVTLQTGAVALYFVVGLVFGFVEAHDRRWMQIMFFGLMTLSIVQIILVPSIRAEPFTYNWIDVSYISVLLLGWITGKGAYKDIFSNPPRKGADEPLK